MKILPYWDLIITAFCIVASLTSSANGEPGVKVQTLSDDHRQGTHKGHGHGNLQKTASLENELRELRNGVDANRQNIASLLQRGGQEEVDEELTEVRPLDIPLHHHEPDDVAEQRRYATTTVRTLDSDDDMPTYEDDADDDDDDDDDDESPDQVDDATEKKKRSHADDSDDEDEDDDEDDEGVYDDNDDDEDEDEVEEVRKKKSSIPSEESDEVADETLGRVATTTVAPTAREALVKDLNAFLAASGKEADAEAVFQGVDKLHEIREIEKRVNIPLKEKYVNAVNPRADEDLLELMVKIAENPREWQRVHTMLQQVEDDLVASRDAAAKRREGDNRAKARHKPNNLTKEERKQQQEEKKKKKKKKQKQREKERLERARQNKNRIAAKEKSPEELRREQLERAGLLAPAGPLMKNQQKGSKTFTTKTVTTSTTQSPVTVLPKLTTSLPKVQTERNPMKSVDSALDYLTKNQPRVILHQDESPKPKSPMQELREKWPKIAPGGEKLATSGKAIVHGRVRAFEPSRPRVAGAQDNRSKQEQDRARNKFLQEAIDAKNAGGVWNTNNKPKWHDSERLPMKDIRGDPNNYFNPNYEQIDMPVYSVDALKHGDENHVKSWPQVSVEQTSGQVKNPWPQLPVDEEADNDHWPDISSTPMDNSKPSQWGRYPTASNIWPNIPQQKPATASDDHAKEASPSNNKQWPHFAYHRVTSSPQSLARQQKEAQQRARHRNAYIAVSIIAPPGKNSSANTTRGKPRQQVEVPFNETRKSPPLPDKMDALLEERGHKLIPVDPLEEQLIDMAAYGSTEAGKFSWNHEQHLDKLKEQLQTLSAMEAKLRQQWLEKERLRQILNDASRRGAAFYRQHRDAATSPTTEKTHS